MLEFLSGNILTIFLCAVGILVVCLVLYMMYRGAKKERDNFAQAIPATAKIIHLGNSETGGGGVDVNLTFEVTPPNGSPYQVKTIWTVEPLSVSKIQEGCTVALKIDAKDPQKLYSAESWAWALSQMPTDLTS